MVTGHLTYRSRPAESKTASLNHLQLVHIPAAMAPIILPILLALSCWRTAVAAATNETAYIEPLFLDLTIQQVLTDTAGMPVAEPWASRYVEALRESRYGDAIWARYHIMGGTVKDIILGDEVNPNITVIDSIEEDAVAYRVDNSDYYAEAISLYATTNSTDQHTDVLDLLLKISKEATSDLQKRITYGIGCSRDNLAYRSDCVNLLSRMGKGSLRVGNVRQLASYGNCYLRLGPYSSATDLSRFQAHAVGVIIENYCGHVPACCRDVRISGYSPGNSGHRKICLSSKPSGCSG